MAKGGARLQTLPRGFITNDGDQGGNYTLWMKLEICHQRCDWLFLQPATVRRAAACSTCGIPSHGYAHHHPPRRRARPTRADPTEFAVQES